MLRFRGYFGAMGCGEKLDEVVGHTAKYNLNNRNKEMAHIYGYVLFLLGKEGFDEGNQNYGLRI